MKKASVFISAILVFALIFSSTFSVVAATPVVSEKPFENSEFFEFGDYSLHYRFAPAEGTAKDKILLVHGFMSSTYYWEGFVPEMTAAGYDCYSIDLPGFGYSTRETPDLKSISREILLGEFMKEIAPGEKWIVAGHSMGGGAALSVATTAPESVKTLLLYAPAAGAGSSQQSSALSDFFMPVQGWLMNLFFSAALLFVGFDFIRNPVITQIGFPSGYDMTEHIEPFKIKNTGMSLVYMNTRTNGVDMQKVKALTIPVFHCVAKEDNIVTPDSSARLQPLLPEQAVFLEMPGNHMFVEFFPKDVAAATLEFLN